MTEKYDNFCKIPISLLLKYKERISFDIYIKLADDKVVKLCHQFDETARDTLRKYQTKGVTDVYADKEQFLLFTKLVQKKFSSQFFSGTTSNIDKTMCLLENSYDIIREGLLRVGINEHSIELAKEVTSYSLNFMKTVPNILKLYLEYKDKSSPAYLRGRIVGYTSSIMIGTFSWSSPGIKEKAALAAMICDITLSPEDFAKLQEWEKGTIAVEQLPEKILRHPIEMSNMLKLETARKDLIPPEVYIIIEQHHEKPDASGFPHSVHFKRINLLSAIYIVANSFVEMLFEFQDDMEKRATVLNTLSKKYSMGNFRKAMNALKTILNS